MEVPLDYAWLYHSMLTLQFSSQQVLVPEHIIQELEQRPFIGKYNEIDDHLYEDLQLIYQRRFYWKSLLWATEETVVSNRIPQDCNRDILTESTTA
jgi:hypothetical protein